MRLPVYVISSLLALSLVPRGWVAAGGDQLALAPESTLTFDGTSTVRNWTCRATTMVAALDAPGAGAAKAVLSGVKAVRTATFTVPTATLECGNGIMNEHMGKALHSERFPSIGFTLTDYDLTPGSPLRGTIRGTLTINGVSKPIAMPAEFAGDDAILRITGSYPLRMTDWSVVPPKLMMGTLTVGETVQVKFALVLH